MEIKNNFKIFLKTQKEAQKEKKEKGTKKMEQI